MALSLFSWLSILFLTFGGFLLSTVAGFGGSLVLVSVLALFFEINIAVAISAPVMLINNLAKAVVFFRHIKWSVLLILLLGTIPGAAVGARLLVSLPTEPLKKIIGILILLIASLNFTQLRWRFRIGKPGLFIMSAAYGFFSGLAGVGGPIKAIALANYGLAKERFVATAAVASFVSAIVRIHIYETAGLFTPQVYLLTGSLILSCFIAIYLGRIVLRRLKESRFCWLLSATIFASCIKIIFW